MLNFGELARFVLGSPIPLYLIFFVLLLIGQGWFERLLGKLGEQRIVVFFSAVIGLLLGGYLCIVVYYLFSNIYLDVISPSIVSVSWLFAQGRELYHAVGSEKIYSLLYGPAAYIVNGSLMKLLGASAFSSKLASVGSLVLTFVFTYFSLKKFLDKRKRILFLGLLAALLLSFWTFSFETRPDAMSLMFLSLALFGATRENPVLATLLTGFGLGMGTNLKINGLFYYIPALFILFKRFKLRAVVLSTIVGVIVLIAPFVLFSNISFSTYLEWLRIAGRHTLDPGTFANNILYVLFLSIPFLAFLWSHHGSEKESRGETLYLEILVICMLIVSVFAAKAGSGQNHLMPFVPLLLYGYARWYNAISIKRSQLILIPFALALVFLSFSNIARVARLYATYPNSAAADIQMIVAKYPNVDIGMGYSNTPGNLNLTTNLPSFRPLLVFAGKDYLLDLPALADFEESGAKFPEKFLKNFQACNPQIWLFPHGTKPFDNVLGYGKVVFDEAFLKSFSDHYHLQESIGFYDLWSCTSHS